MRLFLAEFFPLNRLIRKQTSKSHIKNHFCNYCLAHFTTEAGLEKHIPGCSKQVVYLPSPDKCILKFDNLNRAMDVPFVIYADTECIFQDIQTCIPDPTKSSTTLINKHTPIAFSYYIKCSFNNNLNRFKSFKGLDSPKLFLSELVKDIIFYYKNYMKDIKPMIPLTSGELESFHSNNICHICDSRIENCIKVKDHCHLSGRYRGPAHNSCNLNYKVPTFFPVIFHNFSKYDCHLFVKELNNINNGPINIIPLNKELYISLSKMIRVDNDEIEIRFLDSYRFMQSSLDSLAQNLTKTDFHTLKSMFQDETQFSLLIRKGVFPYNYLNKVEKLNETSLPKREEFFNLLTDKDCSPDDYNHAQKVWNVFDCKTLEDYLMLYLKTDVLLLSDIFENFRLLCKKIYKLDPCHYYTAPGLSWDAMLKITRIELELLQDIEMIRFIQKGIRGGIVQCPKRHSKANNKYMSDYNENLPSSYLMYLDANNLYGWAMSQLLPESGFEWVDNIANFSLDSISDNSNHGYILEVDLEYPWDIHDSHNSLPFCCETKVPPHSKNSKLIADLNNKVKYVIHYKNLQQCLKHGLKLSKIHRILKFKQSSWLEKYILLNTFHRTNAKSTFEKNFFKLLNNAVYGKTMENVDKRRNVKIVNFWENVGKRLGARALIAKPEFNSYTIFDENMIAIELNKNHSTYNKPIYLGFCILELSKWKMYDFHYDYMLPKYDSRVELNYMDTDSFIYTINTDDFYKDIAIDIDSRFDTSDYDVNNQFNIPQKNKKVLGMMKDENSGIIMREFIGLRSKMYSYITENMKEVKKAKGIKINAVNKLSLSDYKNCLYNKEIYYSDMYIFRSKLHEIYTTKVNKISLSYKDEKRFICDNNNDTFAWGHYKEQFINSNEEDTFLMEIDDNSSIKQFLSDDSGDDILMSIDVDDILRNMSY